MVTLSNNFLFQNMDTNNCLLRKDDVGIRKESTFSLPKGSYAYGHPPRPDKENVKAISSKWVFHKESRDRLPFKNFRQMNINSIQEGVCTSRNQKSFRQNAQVIKYPPKGKSYIDYKIPDEHFTYGKPNQYDDSMGFLIGNMYGLQSELNLEKTYNQRYIDKNQKYGAQTVRNNKAFDRILESTQKKMQSFKIQNDDQTKDKFKLKKFLKVNSKINTLNKSDAFVQFQKSFQHRNK